MWACGGSGERGESERERESGRKTICIPQQTNKQTV